MTATRRRIHGRSGRLYVGLADDTATAEPVAFLSKWSLAFTSDKVDVTAFGDSNKVYVAGLPDAQGTYDGFYDAGSDQLYTASQDGLARKFYLYPTTADATYWWGTAFFDFNATGDVAGAVAISGSFNAATRVLKVDG